MNSIQTSIIQTLCYADIFSYPLSRDELVYLFISSKPIKASAIKKQLDNLISSRIVFVDKKSNRYALQKASFEVFKKRKISSKKKLVHALNAIIRLRYIPSISLIGLSGGLAMNNADKDDDIDLFIITAPKTLWITRLATTLLLDCFNLRRKPSEKQVKNKICLNMFIDEDHLSIPKKDRDLFSAHEVVQMKPMFVRGKTYEKFLKANGWVGKYLASASQLTNNSQQITEKNENIFLNTLLSVICYLLSAVNVISKYIQLLYMRNHRTSEVITEGYLRFHPKDGRSWILPEYEKRMKKLL